MNITKLIDNTNAMKAYRRDHRTGAVVHTGVIVRKPDTTKAKALAASMDALDVSTLWAGDDKPAYLG